MPHQHFKYGIPQDTLCTPACVCTTTTTIVNDSYTSTPTHHQVKGMFILQPLDESVEVEYLNLPQKQNTEATCT